MQQFDSLESVPNSAQPLHMAIGMFDGLHLGHRAVIETAVQSAHENNGRSAVLTFWPHPSALFSKKDPSQLIMSPEAKGHVLSGWGVDDLITQQFTAEFAAISAEDFLTTLQAILPQLTAVYVGENWRFGRGRVGDVALLVEEARKIGVSVYSIPRVNLDGEAISSTRIRNLLKEGGIEQVNALLGYSYCAEGKVKSGKGLGSKIGFPTLNLDWAPDLSPRMGVYVVQVSSGKAQGLPAVANYGVRPTVEQTEVPQLEVHVLGDCPLGDRDEVSVEWKHFLRPEMQFEDVEALQNQIELDRTQAQQWFESRRA